VLLDELFDSLAQLLDARSIRHASGIACRRDRAQPDP